MEKYDKSALMPISKVIGTLKHVDRQKMFWNDSF